MHTVSLVNWRFWRKSLIRSSAVFLAEYRLAALSFRTRILVYGLHCLNMCVHWLIMVLGEIKSTLRLGSLL